jgi:hypothetical protein
MKITIALLIILISSFLFPCQALGWDRDEQILEGCVVGSYVADWLQTRQLENRPDLRETGAFGLLGKHPNKESVDLYFVGLIASHIFIANYLKDDWRKVFQMTTLYLSVTTINHNYSVGLKVRF